MGDRVCQADPIALSVIPNHETAEAMEFDYETFAMGYAKTVLSSATRIMQKGRYIHHRHQDLEEYPFPLP